MRKAYKRHPVMRLSVALLAGLIAVVVSSGMWYYLPASACYHVQEAYTFRASGKAAGVRLAVMVPKTGPYQQVRNLAVSWHGTETRETQPAVEVVKLAGHINPNEAKLATIAYDVRLHQGRARWEGPVEPFQLQPQPGIESDEPVLAQAASRMAAGQTRQDVYRIHKFTASRLSWRGQSGTDPRLRLQSALKAYQTRQGVCGHFANLMTALCRASKIPAQSISGLSMPPYPPFWSATRVWGHPAGNHGWTEFHTLAGWELADPSAAHRMPLKGFSFGRSNGSYLSFGERVSQRRTHEAMMAWAATGGSLIGAMSGPLRFAAAADSRVSFSPQATVTVTWSGRWVYVFLLAGLAGVFAVWRLHCWRKRRCASGPTKPLQPLELR